MSELRDRLEQLGERAPSAPDAFERLERARRRRDRNRRITAGAVALLVAIAGSVAVFTAFTGSDAQVARSDDGFVAIWPESTYEDALRVQEGVNAGEQGSQWRLSPYETAYFFASRVLGLSPDRNMAAPEPLGDGLYTIVVRTRTSCSSQPQLRCPPEDVRLVLRQLDNSPKGIWSVVSAQTAGFPDLPAVGAELVAGEPAEISTQVPADQNVYVAFVGLDECAGWEYDVIRSASDVSLRTPTPPEAASDGCPVALIAMHNDPGIQQLTGLGRRLLDYGNRIALYEVLAVPIRLLPSAASGSVPEVATVTCEGASITVDTSVVAAQSDGIHIDVTTIGDTPVSFHVAEDAGADSAVSSQGRGTNESSAEVILQSAPGRYVLSCTAPQEGGVGIASLEVVDPNGSFVPAEPECSGGEAWGMSPAYAPGALGDRGDPVEIARMRLTGLQEGDVVERAGYAQGDGTAIVRIVRDGAVVAKVELFDDGQGGWLLSSMDGCGDAQFGWSSEGSEPTGPSGELCEPPSADLLIVVDEGEFESDVGCVSAPAGESLTITLDNRDSSGHNIWIYPLALDEPVFRGPPCFGPDHITYSVRPLEAGRYRLVDNMNPGGAEMTLVVN